MGTTTFFLRYNDSGKPLNKMGKEELEKLNNLSPYAEKWDLKPVVLESIGKAPLQYPPCEDELEKDEA